LTDPGFDSSVLCEFRKRLIAGNAELLLFETMLTLFRQQGLIKAKGRQRTDSTCKLQSRIPHDSSLKIGTRSVSYE